MAASVCLMNCYVHTESHISEKKRSSYHCAGGGGREEENDLFDEWSLGNVAVLTDWNRFVTYWARTMWWLQKETKKLRYYERSFPKCRQQAVSSATTIVILLSSALGVIETWTLDVFTFQSMSWSSLCGYGARIFGSAIWTTVFNALLGPKFNTCMKTKYQTTQKIQVQCKGFQRSSRRNNNKNFIRVFFQPLYRLAAFCLQLVWDGIPQRIMVYGLIMTWSKDMVLHATHWCNQTFPLRYICCVRVIVVNYQTAVKNGLYWVAKHCRKISNI